MISVLIYSCDSYSDVWKPFFTLFWRYWNCEYPVYLATETKKCAEMGVMTINKQADTWTERMKQTVDEIPTDFVIGMCEDMFLRREVNQNAINECVRYMQETPKIACFNFEKDYNGASGGDFAGYGKKPHGRNFQKSCQPTLWRRSALSELLNVKMSAWEWEESDADEKFDYYIFTGSVDDLVFEYGYKHECWFGIQKGKWVKDDVGPLFAKEHIDIDFTKRGYV